MSRSPKEVRDFFASHWTVRKYENFKMPTEHFDVIVEAAQRAPTDATAQMYSFIRLTEDHVRRQVAELCSNPHIATASESFVICADIHRLEQTLRVHSFEPGRFPQIAIHFALGDAVLAGQNMLIAAEMLGYQGCWIGGVVSAPQEISELLKLPEGVFPFAALTIGKPAEPPQHRPRLPRNQILHENQYRQLSQDEIRQAAVDMAPITARGNWPETLARYFAKGGTMEAREPKMRDLLNQQIFRSPTAGSKD